MNATQRREISSDKRTEKSNLHRWFGTPFWVASRSCQRTLEFQELATSFNEQVHELQKRVKRRIERLLGQRIPKRRRRRLYQILGIEQLEARMLLSATNVILSTDGNATLGGLTFGKKDLADYDLNADAATLIFDGEAIFVDNSEDISAVHVLDNGHLILSNNSVATIGGLTFQKGDLAEYDPSTGTATLFFDGNTLFSQDENIDAVHILDNGHIVLSTANAAVIGGLSFGREDLVEYDPISGIATLLFDGSSVFSNPADIDAVHILDNGNIVFSTSNSENDRQSDVREGRSGRLQSEYWHGDSVL